MRLAPDDADLVVRTADVVVDSCIMRGGVAATDGPMVAEGETLGAPRTGSVLARPRRQI